jgi:hypothetical protein
MDAKLCTGCGQEKPLDHFYPVKKGLPELRAQCKTCTAEVERKRDVKNYQYSVSEKFCICCGQTKSAADFRKNDHTDDGLNYYCIECGRKHQEAVKFGAEYDSAWVPAEKYCLQCKVMKPMESFGVQAHGPFGRNSTCKICHNKNRREAENRRAQERRESGWTRPVTGEKRCHQCTKILHVLEFSQDIKTIDGLQKRCNTCNNEIRRQQRAQLRLEALTHYSNGNLECDCCQEHHIEFLCLDHINGGGTKHRQELSGGMKNGSGIFQWAKKNNYPEGLRVLCHCCNMSIAFYGYCPHERERGLIRPNL